MGTELIEVLGRAFRKEKGTVISIDFALDLAIIRKIFFLGI